MENEKIALFGSRYNNPNFAQNKSFEHPANAYARMAGAASWDELLEKMRKGFVAVGRVPYLPSKSTIGMTLFLNVVQSVEGLIFTFDDIGQLIMGFREHFPADMLADYDAAVKAKEEKFSKFIAACKTAVDNPDTLKVVVDSYSQFDEHDAETVYDKGYDKQSGMYFSTTRRWPTGFQSIPRSMLEKAASSSSGHNARTYQAKAFPNQLLAKLVGKLK